MSALGVDLADLTGVPERVLCETCTCTIDLAAQADAAVGCVAGGFHCLSCLARCGDCGAVAAAQGFRRRKLAPTPCATEGAESVIVDGDHRRGQGQS